MRLEFGSNWVKHKDGLLKVNFPVWDAREVGETIIVLYDYTSFPPASPARNLFAYANDGTLIWQIDSIGAGATDAVTNIISEIPFIVGNFAGCTCEVDVCSGVLLKTRFTK